MAKELKYIEKSFEGKPSFLLKIDGKEYISNGCVFEENTKENINYLIIKYDCKGFIDELLNSKDIESLLEVTNMSYMFWGAKSFNQDISSWNTSNVIDMYGMFWGAKSFNQDLSSWNVSKVKDMYAMFYGAKSFNQDLNSWDTSNVECMHDMFDRSGVTNLPSWYKDEIE